MMLAVARPYRNSTPKAPICCVLCCALRGWTDPFLLLLNHFQKQVRFSPSLFRHAVLWLIDEYLQRTADREMEILFEYSWLSTNLTICTRLQNRTWRFPFIRLLSKMILCHRIPSVRQVLAVLMYKYCQWPLRICILCFRSNNSHTVSWHEEASTLWAVSLLSLNQVS